VGEPRAEGNGDRPELPVLAEARRRGHEAAGELLDRWFAALDGDDGAGGPPRVRAPSRRSPGALAPPGSPGALEDLVEAWAELARLSVDVIAAGAVGAGTRGPDGGRAAVGAGAGTRDGTRDGTRAQRPPAPTALRPTPDTGAGPAPDTAARLAPETVDDHLRAVGRRVRRAMLAAVPDAEPHDWLYRLVRAYPSRPAKAIRPALCLATCRAFGGSDDHAFGAAVAIELLHNAFLVHDDIADGSDRRRGRPTLRAEYGTGLALNAGDATAILANQVLRRHAQRLDDDLGEHLLDEFDTMALRTLEGQAMELGWQRDAVADLRPEDYLHLILRKTCWYTTIHPLRVGALLGSDGRANLAPMVRFGFHLGASFQIQDDLLNLVGDESLYGKEINGDLREGKRTLVLIHLAGRATGPDRAAVDRYLRLCPAERTPAVIAEIRGLIDAYGSIEFTRAYGEGIARSASDAFEAAFADAEPGPDTDLVRALVPYMLGRTR
jgi:geranylgeranyl diphosphate synthase type II